MDYKNGKIYKIVDIGYTKMYIGSTTQPLYKRFSYHKESYIRWKNNKHNKVMVFDIFEEFGIDNCKIELIEECPCENRMELCKKEGEYIKNNNCVNKYIAGRTDKEYYETNRDNIREQQKKYRETNKDKIAEYNEVNKDKIAEQRKEYREVNKDRILEQKKEYYEVNKDKILEKRKKYLETNKDKINARRRELWAIKKANKEIIIE
jgi:hypothetical protein